MFEYTEQLKLHPTYIGDARTALEYQATNMVKMILRSVTDGELRDQKWDLTLYLRPHETWEQAVEPGGVTPY